MREGGTIEKNEIDRWSVLHIGKRTNKDYVAQGALLNTLVMPTWKRM